MSYVSEVLADSPTAYWHLDEVSGNIVDAIGGITLSPVNSPVLGRAGLAGTSFYNSGTNYYETSTGIDALKWSLNTSMAIEFLFKRGDLNLTTRGILGHRTSSTNDRHFVVFFLLGVLNVDVQSSRWGTGWTPTDLNWHHFVINYDGATGDRELWVDGKLYFASTLKATSADSTAGIFQIGSMPANTPQTGGYDEIAIYMGSKLSSARITAHWLALQNKNSSFIGALI